MKKAFSVMLILAILINTTACQKDSIVIIDENVVIKPEASKILSSDVESLSDNDEFKFSDLADLEFWFASGAGGWSTTLKIESEGKFSGYYHDSDMGDAEDDYPNGIRYECYFSGKFTQPIKVGDYEYSLKCESISIKEALGKEEIIDGVKIVYSEPYGLDNADEVRLYLPEKRLNELPSMFLGWVSIDPDSIDSETVDVLSFYGLYNVSGEQGFSSYEED